MLANYVTHYPKLLKQRTKFFNFWFILVLYYSTIYYEKMILFWFTPYQFCQKDIPCYFFLNFIYLFLAVLGLRFCARASSSCSEQGPLFIVVRGPLTIAASLVEEHRLQTRRLSSCGSRAQLLRGMWDLPRPGLKPMSPALAGRFSTTAPPGKPYHAIFKSKNL